MIVLWGTVGLEVLLQMVTGLESFLRAFGSNEDIGKVKKFFLWILIFTNWLLGTYNATMCVFSISMAWFHVILDSIWLCQWSGKRFKIVFCWCMFYRWLYIVIKTPVLIICGLMNHGVLEGIMRHQSNETALTELLITGWLWLLYKRYFNKNKSFVKEFIVKNSFWLLLIGVIEFIEVIYLLNVLETRFEFYALVLMVTMVLIVVSFLIIIVFYMLNQKSEREKQMVLSRERIMQNNYRLLKQEQEINRKNIHDHRHELNYLYHCFQEGDYKQGCVYIEKKNHEYQIQQNEKIWTGNSCIDFLVNKAWKDAKNKEIHFKSAIDVTGLPIAEYDFFTILENLLENAIEAAEKCDIGNRFINLKIYMINEIFIVELENSYRVEPALKHGRFLTIKDDKEAHGWGIENIKELVNQNEGTYLIEYVNHIFSFQIMFGI